MLGVHRNMDHVLHVIESFYFLTQTIVSLDLRLLISDISVYKCIFSAGFTLGQNLL